VQKLGYDVAVHSVACSPDGKWIAGGTDTDVRLWEATTGQPAGVLEGPQEPVTALAFSPDSKLLACGGAGGMAVWLFRVEDGEPLLLIPDPLEGCNVEALAFHPAGRLLGVAGIDPIANENSSGAAALWDITERCEIATFPGGARALVFDRSGNTLITASVDQTICIWNLADRKLTMELDGHDDTIEALALSPDGKWLASGGDDFSIRSWDTSTWTEKPTRELDCQVKQLTFTPDGKSLYVAGGNTMCYRLDVALKT
jgi:WD40 repeat protein